jgi:hypothetical protein
MINEEFQKEVINLLKDIKSNTDNSETLKKLYSDVKEIKKYIDAIKTDTNLIEKNLDNRNV